MKSSRFWFGFLLLFSLIFLCLPSGGLNHVSAQAEELTIAIDRPGEGEHLYAGPKTLLYSIPIAGWVYSATFDPAYISLELEILQDEKTILQTPLRLGSDREFSIHATVNPQSTLDVFKPQHGVNCDSCHHAGSINLVPGELLIRITASDPFGHKAVAERHIVVDYSTYTTIPVQLEIQGASQGDLANIPVTGSTRLYLWRTRYSTSLTDEHGQTTLQVEALSEAPTDYLIRVEPAIVNGTLYESVEPVKIHLLPATDNVSAITLKIRSRMGEITGQLLPSEKVTYLPDQIWAVNLLSGKAFSALVLQDGHFAFENLPYGQYQLTLELTASQSEGIALVSEKVNLDGTSFMPITLPLLPVNDRWVRIHILDEQNNPLPFAWLLFEGQDHMVTALPESGIAIGYFSSEMTSTSIQVTAPGMIAKRSELEPAIDEQLLKIQLNRSPETQTLPWGEGEVVIPSESDVLVNQDQIRLLFGWLWGNNSNASPLSIEIPSGLITIEQGRFALEYLTNQNGWLFLMEGEAHVRLGEGLREWTVQEGQMIALVEENYEGPVLLDPIALSIIRSGKLPAPLHSAATAVEEYSNNPLSGTQLALIVTFILIFILIILLLIPQIRKLRLKATSIPGYEKVSGKEAKRNGQR